MFKKLYPNFYFNKITDISSDFLKEENISACIMDLDNTIIDGYLNLPEENHQWIKQISKSGIKFIILSNSSNKRKVRKFAELLGLEYILNAAKPFSVGFSNAISKLQTKKENTCIIGDQVFTDVLGGNIFGIKSILVKPIAEKEEFIIKIKRLFELPIISTITKNKKH